MKTTLTIILLSLFLTSNGQYIEQQRIESQQDMSIPFLVMGIYFGFGIVHYAQPYKADGKLNGTEECAFLALGTLTIA